MKLKIKGIYKLKYKGAFNIKHIYFGTLTDLKEGRIIFDNNLYLRPEDIIWIQSFKSKNDIYKLELVNLDKKEDSIKLNDDVVHAISDSEEKL